MGIITAALGGAGEGLEKGSNLTGGLYLKSTLDAEHQRLAQEAQATREERNIRLTKQLEAANEAAKPIAPGYTVHGQNGQPDYQAPAAPEKSLTPEQSDLLKAEAEYYRSHGQAVLKAANSKEPKPTLPKLTPIKDETGNTVGVLDENSGAFGVPTPGVPAQEAVSHWLKFWQADEPAKAAVPPGLQWFNAARQPIAGIHVYYPEMQKRVPAETGTPVSAPAAATDPLGLRASLPKVTPAAAMPAASPAARAAPAASVAQPAPVVAETGSGATVDAAKQKLSAAVSKLQSYGLRQQRADPKGFALAQQARDAAQREYDSVLAQYQNELGPVGAARFRPR